MADQTRLDRLNQGLAKLNIEEKQYIARLTSRLLQGKAPDSTTGLEKTSKISDPLKRCSV
ncbi:hypothetical protein AGMMS50293_27190 [Spirochaetia bacterium]|nr:hypothetical protein AGMMS50293_27190 [Spirochaetia bacterium]